MAATITDQIVSVAPGATCMIAGTGLTGGGSAGVSLAGQGGDGTAVTTLEPTFNGTTVSFRCPDGAVDGMLTVTASDATTATVPLRVNAQYVFGAEFVGQGVDVSVLATGELDAILQTASAYADAYIGQGSETTASVRQLQVIEEHRYRSRSRRVYPRRWPIVSLDAFTYIASPDLTVAFAPGDFVVVPDLGYIEQVIWSLGFTMVQAFANFTMVDAGIVRMTYTAGYGWAKYPPALREAVKMIATELIAQRGIQDAGMGGLSRVKNGGVQYDRRNEPFAIPAPAMALLDSIRRGSLA